MKKISLFLAILALLMAILPSASAIEFINYSAQQRIYAQQYVIETDVNGIMQDTKGNYAMVSANPKTHSQIYTPVGRYDVLLTSKSSVDALQNVDSIGQELKNDIIEMSKTAEVCMGCDCNTVSIYSPDLLPTSQKGSTYEYYDGHRMKVELISKAAHAGFENIANGRNMESIAASILNVIISVVGVGSQKVGIFGVGVTLMSAIYDQAGVNNVYSSSSNEVQAKIRHHYERKYTYGELNHLSGDWMLGCVSSCTTIDEYVFSYDFYTDSGQRKAAGELKINCNETYYSEHFKEGYLEKAWYSLYSPWVDEGIHVKIGSKSFILT